MNFLFRNTKWIGTDVDKIEADVFLSSSVVYTRQIPQHPVQGKTKFTDNVVKDPPVITVVGILSETSLLGIPVPMQVRKRQVEILYKKLLKLYEDTDSSTIVSIMDGEDRYDDMTLARLEVPKTPDDGASRRFSATFKKVEIIEKSFIDVEGLSEVVPGDGTKSDMANAKDKGSAVKENAANKSIIKSGADKALDFLGKVFNKS